MLAAFVVAERLYPGRPLALVSLGTGNFTNPIDGAAAKRWGLGGWAWKLLDLLSDGQSAMSEATMRCLLGVAARADSHYHRVQPDLPAGLGRMDDTSQEDVATVLAHLFIRHGRDVCVARRPRCGDCVLRDL